MIKFTKNNSLHNLIQFFDSIFDFKFEIESNCRFQFYKLNRQDFRFNSNRIVKIRFDFSNQTRFLESTQLVY